MTNYYYILPVKELQKLNYKNVVGDLNNIAYNLDKSFFILKMKQGKPFYKSLSEYKPLTQKEIREITTDSELWIDKNDLPY